MDSRFEQLECDLYSHIHQCAHMSEELLKFMHFISSRYLEFQSLQSRTFDKLKVCVNDLEILKQSTHSLQIQMFNLNCKCGDLEEQIMETNVPLSSPVTIETVVLAVAKSIGATSTKRSVSL